MEETQNKEKSCVNCRYFSQHYSKQKTRYIFVNCGHCLNQNVQTSKRRQSELCRYWEDISIQKEERKMSIKEILEFMSERLNQIAMILKDDSDVTT